MDLQMLEEKFNENPNLRGAIRDITSDSPLESSEVQISNEEAELLQKHFEQAERANLWLEWNGIKDNKNYPTFYSYLLRQIQARESARKLLSLRKEIERQQEEERMRF